MHRAVRIVAQNFARTRACASATRLTLPHSPFNGTFEYIQTLWTQCKTFAQLLAGSDSDKLEWVRQHLETIRIPEVSGLLDFLAAVSIPP